VNLSPEKKIVTERFDLKTGVPELDTRAGAISQARFTIGTQDGSDLVAG
jgi:hypothetical protein